MKLFFKKTGDGKPFIILHGLFGMSDNWMTLAKQFAENGFSCYTVDQRNHGRSGHSEEFNYHVMADDLAELMQSENISSANFIGHSMGGKTAMFFAVMHPDKTEKLIVADISPRYFEPHHDSVIAAIKSVDLDEITSRKEAEEKLRISIDDEATVQFLLKNLYWKEMKDCDKYGAVEVKKEIGESEKKLAWRFNLTAIEKNIKAVGEALPIGTQFNKPVLFVKGEKSGYITSEDATLIKEHFPLAIIKSIPKAGHWVHAENPGAFKKTVLEFLID